MNDQPIPARRLWAGLQLLDRQLRDRNGMLCGKVDDLELARDEDTGALTVRAILSGPGRLASRMGRRRVPTSPSAKAVHPVRRGRLASIDATRKRLSTTFAGDNVIPLT